MTHYRIHKFTILLLALFFCVGVRSFGQTTTSSPYSRYGIGDIQSAGVNQTLGMGGIGLALYNGLSLNFSNPAAYGRLQLTTFEAGINANFLKLSDTEKSRDNNSISLGYFAFAVPLKTKKAGLGFGIVPLSNVGYSIDDPIINIFEEPELHCYDGSGGLHQFFVSAGFTPFKNFTAGINVSTLFGQIIQERRVEFYDPTFLNTRLTDTRSQRGFYFTLGLQYTLDSLRLSPADSIIRFNKKLNVLRDSVVVLERLNRHPDQAIDTSGHSAALISLNNEIRETVSLRSSVKDRYQRGDWNLTAGLTFSPSNSINAKRTVVAETFRYVDNTTKDQIIVKDTSYYSPAEIGDVVLPTGLGFGLALKKGTQWLIGSDIRTQDWSEYRSFGESDSLANSWRWSTGAQFVPDGRGFDAYWKQMQYMAGFHYSQTFLQLNGRQLTEMGVSAGIGFPIRRGLTTIRFMTEVGKRGTTEANLLEEKYIRFSLNFSLNDRWFVKQRYD